MRLRSRHTSRRLTDPYPIRVRFAFDLLIFQHYWDLTIDSVTVIMMVLSLGLSVDYVVHIGHAYLTSPDELNNDGNVRMKMALEKQGAAVFNGAFSTWLAVVTLGSSKSYVFITFFKQVRTSASASRRQRRRATERVGTRARDDDGCVRPCAAAAAAAADDDNDNVVPPLCVVRDRFQNTHTHTYMYTRTTTTTTTMIS